MALGKLPSLPYGVGDQLLGPRGNSQVHPPVAEQVFRVLVGAILAFLASPAWAALWCGRGRLEASPPLLTL